MEFLEKFLDKDSPKNYIKRIPNNIVKLLWFYDGALKNYEPPKNELADIGLNMCVLEPSLISVNLPIKYAEDNQKLGYFPSYAKLTPAQRWKYLNWLGDITQPIDIGYVFIFYYGLERHLFLGNFEDAFNTTILLRKYHNTNNSFNSYSERCLLSSVILRDKNDFYFELQKNIEYKLCDTLFLLAKYNFEKVLTIDEIITLSKKIDNLKTPYVQRSSKKMKEYIKEELIKKYQKNILPLDFIEIEKCTFKPFFACANYSIQDIRQRKMPVILDTQLKNEISTIITNAYNKVKGI